MSKQPSPSDFYHSNYERRENDHYPTIDPRCTWAFLEVFRPSGLCVDVCAPNGSGILDALKNLGYMTRAEGDAFEKHIACDWIVTNPPYDKAVVNGIIEAQLARLGGLRPNVRGVAMLLRSNFDFAKTRKHLFRDSSYYAGQIRMLFRPYWTEERDMEPKHNYVWHVWQSKKAQDLKPSAAWYAEGKKP